MTGFIIYHRRPPQRVYTPEEYASMGYNLRGDYDLDFGVADEPLSRITTPEAFVYRADTKKEYYTDFAYSSFKIGSAFVTGGASAAGSTTISLLGSLLG
jgi:hypothetical protein